MCFGVDGAAGIFLVQSVKKYPVLYVATTYNWAKVVTLDGPRRFALDQTRFHLDGHGISSVTRPDFVLDLPGSALDPAEPCSCTLRKALPLQSAKGLRPLYSGPIKHKRIILSTGIIRKRLMIGRPSKKLHLDLS